MILRAKTVDLLQTGVLTEKQKQNSDLNFEEMQRGNTNLSSYPRRIVLELTNACNIKCIMCGRDEADFKPFMLDLTLIKKLDTLLNSVEEVTLFGWGEPTIYPEFVEILEYLNRFPVRKYFVTNGTRLRTVKEALFDCHVDIMAVSLDGACAATNERIRKGSQFDQIVSSLVDIVKDKNKRGLDYPYINFVFTAMRSNIQELSDMVKLAYRLGIQEVKVVYLTVFTEKLLHESLWNCQDKVKAVFEEAVSLAKMLGIKIKLPHYQGEDTVDNQFHKNCYVGWRDFFIGSDGFVRPCQSTPIKLFHFDEYNTFEEMWNSPGYQKFRAAVNDCEKMPAACKRCYQSSHANWNNKSSFIQIGSQFAPKWDKDDCDETPGA